MTCLAFDGKYMAADSGVSMGNSRICGYEKIVYNRTLLDEQNWYVASLCGSVSHIEEMAKVLSGKQDTVSSEYYENVNDSFGMVVYKDMKPRFVYANGKVSEPLDTPFLAAGSGTDFLMGVLAAGKTAMDAVHLAQVYNDGSFGKVRYVDLQQFFNKDISFPNIKTYHTN